MSLFGMLSLLLLASAGMRYHGHAYEVFYTGECKPGPVLGGRPAVGRRVVVRPGMVNSDASPIAETIVAQDGSYELTVIGQGQFCIVPAEGYGPKGPCLVTFRGAVEGLWQEDLR